MGDRSQVKRFCDARGIKYAWLAKQLGISRSHFDHIEAGRRNPPEGYHARIALILGVPAELLRPTQTAEVA